jgi:hypothetical protein
MYLITSKNPTGHVRHAVASTPAAATSIAARMRLHNPDGIVVIERSDGVTVVGSDKTEGDDATVCIKLARAGWESESTAYAAA